MYVYFLVGPTASGKTGLSVKLAEMLNAEIISCDSMCVYKGMDILTSKPPAHLRKRVRHHLINIMPPSREFSAAMYRELALRAIKRIIKRGKTPLFVGGSGLYLKAVIDGIFPSGKRDLEFRRRQELLAKRYGRMYLYKKLMRIDPVAAGKIHPNNLRYVIRALEIYHVNKERPSEARKKAVPLGYPVKIYGIKIDRKELYARIEKRVEDMFKNGIINEVRRLSCRRLSRTAASAVGYKEVLGYIKGEYPLDEAKALLKKNTRHLAKRQMTWFRRDARIKWLSADNIPCRLMSD